MKNQTRTFFILVSVILPSFLSTPCLACSCAFSETAQEEYKKVDMVFTGTVLKVQDIEGYQQLTTFQLLQGYKGDLPKSVEVLDDLPKRVKVLTNVPGPSCGITFDEGKSYLVYAYYMDNQIFTNSCSRTKEVSQARLDLSELNRWLKSKSKKLSACEQAKGILRWIDECDGSKSEWCEFSLKEQCYADQVKDGRCTVGEYSEELKGIVGITPRILCEEGVVRGDE